MPHDIEDIAQPYKLREGVSDDYADAMRHGAMLMHNADNICAPSGTYDPYNTQPYSQPPVEVPMSDEYRDQLAAGVLKMVARDGVCLPDSQYPAVVP